MIVEYENDKNEALFQSHFSCDVSKKQKKRAVSTSADLLEYKSNSKGTFYFSPVNSFITELPSKDLIR